VRKIVLVIFELIMLLSNTFAKEYWEDNYMYIDESTSFSKVKNLYTYSFTLLISSYYTVFGEKVLSRLYALACVSLILQIYNFELEETKFNNKKSVGIMSISSIKSLI
jgi:hypothetical protein